MVTVCLVCLVNNEVKLFVTCDCVHSAQPLLQMLITLWMGRKSFISKDLSGSIILFISLQKQTGSFEFKMLHLLSLFFRDSVMETLFEQDNEEKSVASLILDALVKVQKSVEEGPLQLILS